MRLSSLVISIFLLCSKCAVANVHVQACPKTLVQCASTNAGQCYFHANYSPISTRPVAKSAAASSVFYCRIYAHDSLAITCIPTIHDMRNLFARLVASSLSLSLSLVCQWRNGATGQAPNRNTPSHTFTLYNCLGLMMLLQLTSSFA